MLCFVCAHGIRQMFKREMKVSPSIKKKKFEKTKRKMQVLHPNLHSLSSGDAVYLCLSLLPRFCSVLSPAEGTGWILLRNCRDVWFFCSFVLYDTPV